MELPFNHHAGPKRFEQARFLKKSPTPAENHLWQHLRDRKLNYKFRRQHPIDKYIADFYCHECKLVIEVDGEIHKHDNHLEYDKERTRALESLDLRVVRFTNEQVLKDVKGVLKEIQLKLSLFPDANQQARQEKE